MLIIVNIVFILFYLQVEPVYLRVSNKPIQITSCVINIGNTALYPHLICYMFIKITLEFQHSSIE